jgi:hypothetical protein
MTVVNSRYTLMGAVACAALIAASPALADIIQTQFNFAATQALVSDTGNITTATTITPGAPDVVTSILSDNTGLVSLTTIVSLTDPTPVTLGASFTKQFTTALGVFLEKLTVTSVTAGATSLGITATGTIAETTYTSGPVLTPWAVFYTAAYTQNNGSGGQINGSFNNGTLAVPGPVVGAGLPGLILAFGGMLGWMRRRKQAAA